MLKVASFDIVFQEIPGEVTLALNLSNCPCHCPGCHSPHLAEDIGEELNEELLDGLIARYGAMITCVAFMGGDAAPDEVLRWAEYVKSQQLTARSDLQQLKTAWYSGRPALPDSLTAKRSYSDNGLTALAVLQRSGLTYDYVKLGPYIESLGGLKSPTTNQRLYKRVGDQWQDITSVFWKKSVFDQ